jgi:RNA polymerase sigma-70 factor (ECF subfamily)
VAEPLVETEAERTVVTEPPERLARLVQEQFGFVWRLLRRIGVPESDADDAAQQAFIAASRRIGDIRLGSERAFLFSTALHIGSRARRSRIRKREDLGAELDEQADPTPPLEDLVDRGRARELLDTLLAEMPLELEVIFVLYEIEQLTTTEIAEVVGVPTGTVASRLRRAREDFAGRVARLEARRKFGGKSDD